MGEFSAPRTRVRRLQACGCWIRFGRVSRAWGVERCSLRDVPLSAPRRLLYFNNEGERLALRRRESWQGH